MFEFLEQEIIRKFIRFVLVGFSGLVVDYSVTWVSKEKLKIQKFIANAIGFSTAATTNYFFNRIWTFHSTDPEIMIEYSQFLLISLIGLGINTFILWLILKYLKINFYVAKFFAILVVTVWNFFANLYFTFA